MRAAARGDLDLGRGGVHVVEHSAARGARDAAALVRDLDRDVLPRLEDVHLDAGQLRHAAGLRELARCPHGVLENLKILNFLAAKSTL